MTKTSLVASQLNLTIGGAALDNEGQTLVAEVTVEQHTHLPHMVWIRLYDPELKLLDDGPFDLTKEVQITAQTASGATVALFKGEITALEPAFNEGMNAELLVRGYDRLHRLYRESKSRAFRNIKDSDLAERITQEAGLAIGEITPTSIIYDHVYQANQSNLAFLMQRAWRIGYECFVDEAKLYFRRPNPKAEGVTLTWGDELLSFHPRMSLAEQVDEVIVKGWDPEKQTTIIGRADQGGLYPTLQEAKNGAAWAAERFGRGKVTIVNQPLLNQAEADLLATARLNELSGAFVEAHGVAFRRPDIRAGKTVTLRGLGKRFSGVYLVTSATHSFTSAGLTTTFAVRGARSGLLTEPISSESLLDRWFGLVTAVVTNTDDPKQWGRVKLKFPWLADDAESDWARVMGIGAGPQAGLFIMPEVNDEVVVAFVHGEFSHPIVLGGLWNGQHALPADASAVPGGKKPGVRTLYSLHGQKITLDDVNKKLIIEGNGDLEIKATGDLTIKTDGNIKLAAGADIDLDASGQVTITGTTINLN